MKKVLIILGSIVGAIVVLLVAFSSWMYFDTAGEYSVPLTVADDPSIPHIQIGSTIFHAETFGSDTNEVVIIIHGGPGNDYRYLLPLKPLSEQYFLIYYDQRGTGLSPRVEKSEHSLEISINDLHDVINYYAPGRKVNLIGHSWGAMLTSGYIARHPERVNKAVLAEPGMLTSEQGRIYIENFKIEPEWSATMAMIRIAFESLHLSNTDPQARGDYIFGKIPLLDFDGNPMIRYFCNEDPGTASMDFWRLSAVASMTIQGSAVNEAGDVEIDLVSGVEDFTDKVLFMVSECNQIIGEAFQKGHIKHFPNAEMVIIENAGHTMFGEQADTSMAVIRNYFEEE